MEYPLLILAIVVLIILVAGYFFLFSTGTGSYQPTTTINQTGKTYSQIFGVVQPVNLSVINFVISQGMKYFRSAAFYNQTDEQQVSSEEAEGVNYMLIGFPIIQNGTVTCYAFAHIYCPNSNWTLGEWNASIPITLAAYPNVHEWEIGNEPLGHESGFNNGSAYNYYLLIKGASTIIKQEDPNATVICFGGALINSQQYRNWAQQVWSYGASQYCDAISVHAYDGVTSLLNQSYEGVYLNQSWNTTLYWYENLTHKPIWITETGQVSSSPNTQASQAEFMSQDFKLFTGMPFVQRVYWFNLYGSAYSLISASGQPVPAFYTFMSYYNSSAVKQHT